MKLTVNNKYEDSTSNITYDLLGPTNLGTLSSTLLGDYWPFQDWNWPYTTVTTTGTSLTYSFIEFKDGKGSLEVDIPGVKKDKIEVTLEKGVITIKSERKGVASTRNYLFSQIVDPDLTEAKLEDGVLVVTLTEKKAPVKRIEIK